MNSVRYYWVHLLDEQSAKVESFINGLFRVIFLNFLIWRNEGHKHKNIKTKAMCISKDQVSLILLLIVILILIKNYTYNVQMYFTQVLQKSFKIFPGGLLKTIILSLHSREMFKVLIIISLPKLNMIGVRVRKYL